MDEDWSTKQSIAPIEHESLVAEGCIMSSDKIEEEEEEEQPLLQPEESQPFRYIGWLIRIFTLHRGYPHTCLLCGFSWIERTRIDCLCCLQDVVSHQDWKQGNQRQMVGIGKELGVEKKHLLKHPLQQLRT